jgi:hypothetical protein
VDRGTASGYSEFVTIATDYGCCKMTVFFPFGLWNQPGTSHVCKSAVEIDVHRSRLFFMLSAIAQPTGYNCLCFAEYYYAY